MKQKKNKADLYKISNPIKAPKPKEYEPEKEMLDWEKEMLKIFKAHEELNR